MIIYHMYVTLYYLIELSHTQGTFIYCFLTPTSNMQREKERNRQTDRQTDREMINRERDAARLTAVVRPLLA